MVLRSPSNSPTATEYPEDTARITLSERAKQGEGQGPGRKGLRDHPGQTLRCIDGKTEAKPRPRPRCESRVGKVSRGIWDLRRGEEAVGAEGEDALGAGLASRVGLRALPQGQDPACGVRGDA